MTVGGERSSEETAVRVLAVDDHEAFRAAVRDLIAATSGFRFVGEATSGPEALLAVETLHPELILLDVQMPGMDGVQVAQRISAKHPATLIVLVSAADPHGLPVTACLAGTVPMERKQDLCPRRLRELWAARPTSSRSDEGAGAARP
jgi:DNA-binding NarL/FixJ family response regulator